MYTNKTARKVTVGSVDIGMGAPVAIQTMWKKPLVGVGADDLKNIADELKKLKSIGCDIIRFAAPNLNSADILGKAADVSPMPVVADIHFDYKIALRCMDFKIAKIRINPGNIGAEWKVKEVIEKAKDKNIPIRVGINSGSLPEKLRSSKDKVSAIILAAEEEAAIFEKYYFQSVIFSLKASDVKTTIKANELFAQKFDYPLHIGVTEAGPLIDGIVKNCVCLIHLLEKDIGSTIRVSLSSQPDDEIFAAKAILNQCGKTQASPNIVSCPKCGRATFDVHNFLSKVYYKINQIKKPVTVSIMGCVVNGPQEAKEADLGITGSGNSVVIFKKGEIIKKTTYNRAEEEFIKELENF